MKRLWVVLLALLGVPALVGAQPCNSTRGQLEYCDALTQAVRFGFPRYATANLPTCDTNNKGAVAFDTTAGTYKGCNGSSWSAFGGSGITNSAGANVVTKSDGTNVVASGITDDGTTVTSAEHVVVGSNAAGKNIKVNATLGAELAPALTAGNWTVGAGWESPIVGPGLIKNAAGTGTQTPSAATTIVAGTMYRVSITVINTTVTGGFTWTLGGVTSNACTAAVNGADGTCADNILAGTTGKLIITPITTARFTISAISIKAIPTTTGTITADGLVSMRTNAEVYGTMTFYGLGGGTSGNVLRFPVGGISTSTIGGISNGGSSELQFGPGGGGGTTFGTNSNRMGSAGTWGWAATTNNASAADTMLSRGGAAATLQLGAANAASPVAQTLQAQGSRGGTDTDTAGGSLTIQPGTGTGNSVPAILMLKAGGLTPTSGTTAQSVFTRVGVGASKVLTNNSAIGILNATEAANTPIGGKLDYCIEITDGTDIQSECGNVIWAGVNKAGAFTNQITEVSTQAVSAGTLATTWAISGANPAVISINANSSLTPSTGYPRIVYNYSNLSQQSLAVQ